MSPEGETSARPRLFAPRLSHVICAPPPRLAPRECDTAPCICSRSIKLRTESLGVGVREGPGGLSMRDRAGKGIASV
jgi:hypothetical protein